MCKGNYLSDTVFMKHSSLCLLSVHRCRILYILDPTASKTAIYGESKQNLARLRDVRTPSPKELQNVQEVGVSNIHGFITLTMHDLLEFV